MLCLSLLISIYEEREMVKSFFITFFTHCIPATLILSHAFSILSTEFLLSP
jgi:hypothetical protein